MLGTRRTTPLRSILLNSLNHIENLDRAVEDLYDKEFQDLKQFSEGLKNQSDYVCSEGEKEVNRKKNRYKDILPFNVTRVVLRGVKSVNGSDYVNANYIRGASGSPAYIASQGPLPNTVNDFWKMVVECEVQVIVMACNAEESGKYKCENYWVEREEEERTFGMVEIKLLKAKVICPDFLVRTMRIRYTKEKDMIEERTVCQFHYSAWPDHGVPPLVRPLLEMVRLVRDTQASETLPVLVHCSAGCGRTGTICAIDFVWGLLRLGKLKEDFSLYNLVRDMRKQRVAMVQTKEQYVLVHHAVRELFKEQLQLIDSHIYANVDLRSQQDPIYESLPLTNNHCDEKQDRSKYDELDGMKSNTLEKVAPPLPKKKCAVSSYSKQEKEVENLTEKNRSFQLKTEVDVDGFPNISLIRRPKIAKLRALFERVPNGDRAGSKVKSHTVSRSHSLGPARKPLLTEVIAQAGNERKPKVLSEPPIKGAGKLKVPKLIAPASVVSRPMTQVKRSKSLKVTKDSTPLLKLLQYASADELIDDKPDGTNNGPFQTYELGVVKGQEMSKNKNTIYLESHRRRRSLESLIGDDSQNMEWPLVKSVSQTQEKRTAQPPVIEPNKSKYGLSFRQQFQLLTNASQKRMSSLASGLGIRERRNSFRQAVSKEDCYERITGFGSEGRFVSVPEDAAAVVVDGSSKDLRDTLTVKNQNGEILRGGFNVGMQSYPRERELLSRQLSQPITSQQVERNSGQHEFKEPRATSHSMRVSSKNRFLSKLKSELQSHNNLPEKDSATNRSSDGRFVKILTVNHEHTIKQQVRPSTDVAKTDLKSRGSYFLGFKRSTQSGSEPRSGTDVDVKKLPTSLLAPSPGTLNAPVSPGTSHHTHRPSARTEKPRRKTQPYVSSDDLYVSLHNRSILDANGSLKTGNASPMSSLSSDNLSDYAKNKSAPGTSDELLLMDTELSRRNLDRLRSMLDRSKQDYGSESSSSSGARELHAVMRLKPADFDSQQGKVPWCPTGRSKSTPQAGEILQPVAPPRVRRRGSEIMSRHSLHEPLDGQICPWSLPMTQSNDARHWNGAFGVDLDEVAASMQRQKSGVQNTQTFPDAGLAPENEQPTAVNHTIRKHQYL